MGEESMDEQNYKNAEDALTELLKRNPSDQDLVAQRAAIRVFTADREGVKNDFESLIKIKQENQRILKEDRLKAETE